MRLTITSKGKTLLAIEPDGEGLRVILSPDDDPMVMGFSGDSTIDVQHVAEEAPRLRVVTDEEPDD